MFSLMSKKEVHDIKNNEFDILASRLWNISLTSKVFQKEINLSEKKFKYLKSNNIINNLESNYEETEWEFPKGKRNRYENNSECANREFIEETNIINYTQYTRINHLEEVFYGTNQIKYKHVYYIAGSDESVVSCSIDNYEILNVNWFTLDEIIKLLRNYNTSKINLINQLYFFISIIIKKINNADNKTILSI